MSIFMVIGLFMALYLFILSPELCAILIALVCFVKFIGIEFALIFGVIALIFGTIWISSITKNESKLSAPNSGNDQNKNREYWIRSQNVFPNVGKHKVILNAYDEIKSIGGIVHPPEKTEANSKNYEFAEDCAKVLLNRIGVKTTSEYYAVLFAYYQKEFFNQITAN